MEKAVTIMMVVAAIIITIIAVIVVGKIFGAFSFGSDNSSSMELTIETSSSGT